MGEVNTYELGVYCEGSCILISEWGYMIHDSYILTGGYPMFLNV